MSNELKPCPYIKQTWRGSVICGIMNENTTCVGADKCCIYEDINKRDKRIAELEKALEIISDWLRFGSPCCEDALKGAENE